jgi:hypothetical protein
MPAVSGKESHVDLGFDRVGWVRVIRHGDSTCFEVVGTTRRRPRTCPVSADVACELLAKGVKAVVSVCADCER